MALVIKQTINYPSDLKQEFARMNRDNFSYQGYQALIDYFDELSDDDTDLDVVEICCDFTESSLVDFINDFDIDIMTKEQWFEDQEIPEEDWDCFDDEYEEYRLETIKEYAESNVDWFELLNDDTSIIYKE